MINQTTKTISETINTDYKEYAMYVLANRALPCYIDGFKPVQRVLVYAMLNEHKGKRTKVSDLGGISKFGYAHGETSAMGAAVGLAADWANNVPVFQQHGAFGSRLIPSSAAPRYIFASLNESFYKYFTDFDVMDKREDPEHPEPKTYLPNIPWVLVNGIMGIAVGFACNFLPHSPAEIARHTKSALSGRLKKDTIIMPSIPGFRGTIEALSHNKFETVGIVARTKRNEWTISELPMGYTREKYFNVLTKLEDSGLIVDFEDDCAETFSFIVKVDTKTDKKVALDPIKFFKLSKAFTENYNALDENGELVTFESKVEIIKRFADYRIGKIEQQLKFEIDKCNLRLEWLNAKLAFVEDVLSDTIDFKKVTRKQLTTYCKTSYNVNEALATRLVNTSLVDITKDMVTQLKRTIRDVEAEKKAYESTDAKTELRKRLDDIIKNSEKWSTGDE